MWTKLTALVLSAVLLTASINARAETGSDLAVIPQKNISYRTIEAVTGDLARKATFGVTEVIMPNGKALRAPEDGIAVQVHVNNGDYVEAGDILAEFTVEHNLVALSELELAYDIAAARLERDLAALNQALKDEIKILAELPLSVTTEYKLRTQELKVERARENRDYAKYSGEYSLAVKLDEITKLREKSTDFALTAPISGVVSDMPYLTEGVKVSSGDLLAVVSDPSQLQLLVVGGKLESLKFGTAVTVTTNDRNLPSFTGKVISNTTLLDSREAVTPRVLITADDPASFYELIASRGIRRLSFTVEVGLSVSGSALLVPRGAVKNEGSRQYVYILEDGLSKKRYVLTGMSDMSQTQILEGIEEGTLVILD